MKLKLLAIVSIVGSMKEQQKLAQFIAQKAFDKWADENQLFIRDFRKLAEDMVMFEAMHGVKIRPQFEMPKGKEGRKFGM